MSDAVHSRRRQLEGWREVKVVYCRYKEKRVHDLGGHVVAAANACSRTYISTVASDSSQPDFQ